MKHTERNYVVWIKSVWFLISKIYLWNFILIISFKFKKKAGKALKKHVLCVLLLFLYFKLKKQYFKWFLQLLKNIYPKD